MEQITGNDPFESSSNGTYGKAEPEGLLEECWFFGNLLDRRAKTMLRSYSDPCPSSSSSKHSQEEVPTRRSSGGENSKSVIKRFSHGGGSGRHPNLIRTPSLPACMAREGASQEKNMSKSIHNLGRGEEDDAESEFALSRLIRQASLNCPDMTPPSRTSKGMKQSSSAPAHCLEKNPGLEMINMEDCNKMRRRNQLDQTKIMRKSLSDHLKFQQVKGSKDLGFKFDKKEDLNPRKKEKEDKVRRSPCLSEYSWKAQISSPLSIPSWVDKSSSAEEHVKAQIKFWARAIAANVR
ncbi:hypothetical protein U1Q18_024230 [Sarracenia purpurea var. burkii]